MKNILHDIVEVRTISKANGPVSSDSAINELLSEGWVILGIYTTCYDPVGFPSEQSAHVILGRPRAVPNRFPEREGGDR